MKQDIVLEPVLSLIVFVSLMISTLLQIASSVAHLHSLKNPICHRDIKPANVMLCRNRHGYPVLKLTDFGLSRVTDAKENPAKTFMMSTVGGRSPNSISSLK